MKKEVINMEINVGISNRHVHLTREDFITLFGSEEALKKRNDLTQKGEFACLNEVSLRTDKFFLAGVRVLGPFRPYTQVEISVTDSYKLGITCPVRDSGDLEGATSITICGPYGAVVKDAAIIANRHIHVPVDNEYGLKNGDIVKVKVLGEKGGILNNVHVKAKDSYVPELHLDTDDANAHLLKNKDKVIIIKEDDQDEK